VSEWAVFAPPGIGIALKKCYLYSNKSLTALTPQANSRHRSIFKIALIVTYLGFFATQLSYKFYFLASYPYYSSGAASKGQKLGSMMTGANKIFALSLDKRYNGKHLFPHPGPVIYVNPPLPAPREYAEARPVEIFHIFHCVLTQRGPPSTL